MNIKTICLIGVFITFFESCFLFSEKKFVFSGKENESGEEGLFESGKRHYFSSLNFDLDQTKTNNAINKLNQFIREYPDSSKIEEAYRLINDLLMKIERKNYCIADSYFLMRRYQASLIYFQDLMRDFPESHFKEKVLYKICVAQYQLSRKKDFLKSYNEYMKCFPHYSNAKRLKVLYKKL
ncbi:outer membrane protein assembly factor BamD [Blattabacterium cuenoti]|uniref:outer membrane protein assembly factor BamD n=1 Tax=Blattabacterium cuenoti TaxID=1653831 RepID=UPI00163BA853|nr:outer membrane protein assembly factor BamD [Blattabacterium cuenoti]